MRFSNTQSNAINIKDGPALVLAGPGSGKTTVLTARVQKLIEEFNVNPANILVITFTRAAANEMKQRFLARIGQSQSLVSFGTFHSVFFNILRHAYNLNSSQIISAQFRYNFIKESLVEINITPTGDENDFVEEILGEISAVKNNRINIDSYYSKNCGSEEFRRLYKSYENKLKANRLIDFDDMLSMTWELFSQRIDILAAWQSKYKYILVDEAQDMNAIQYDITKMLAAPENNIFLVGDDDQSIYGFRGAMPGILRQFTQDYSSCKQVILDENYRCEEQIVEISTKLIRNNENRFDKKLKAIHKGHGKVTVTGFESISEENRRIIRAITNYRAAGIMYEDMAVLYRTNRQSTLLMEMLLQNGIPFTSTEHIPIVYDSWIAQDIFAYLRLAYGEKKRNDMLKIMNKPLRYLSREFLDNDTVEMDEWAEHYFDKTWIKERIECMSEELDYMSTLSPFAAINYLRKQVGYEEYVRQSIRERSLDVEETLGMLEEITDAAKPFDTIGQFSDHIREFREKAKEQESNKNNSSNENGVRIMTLHGSKGLEYDVVFIPQINDGLLPYKKANLYEQIEEERRLFYVGMTRARMYLNLSWDKTMHRKDKEKSPFLNEI